MPYERPRINTWVEFIDGGTAYGLSPHNKRAEILLLMRANGLTWTHVTAELLSRGWMIWPRDTEYWWRENFYTAAIRSGIIFKDVDIEPLQLPSMRGCGIILNSSIRRKDERKIRKMSREERAHELHSYGHSLNEPTQVMVARLMVERGSERAYGLREDDPGEEEDSQFSEDDEETSLDDDNDDQEDEDEKVD